MDMTLLNDFMRATHLLGMALGFGIAILADLLAARAVIRPLDDRDIGTLEMLHRLVWMGLALLWISGAVLLWLRTGFDLDRFSPKLMTKVGVVVLLTANATAMGKIGLPTMRAYQTWRFGDLPLPQRLQLSSLATISAACWISALTLGVFSQLKPLQWEILSVYVGAVYLVALVAALMAASITPIISMLVRIKENRPRLFRPLPKFRS
ncbi:MAG: hypothetical protein ACR2OY_06085 [Boseongicola sp.]